jgi:hypothetical protein
MAKWCSERKQAVCRRFVVGQPGTGLTMSARSIIVRSPFGETMLATSRRFHIGDLVEFAGHELVVVRVEPTHADFVLVVLAPSGSR